MAYDLASLGYNNLPGIHTEREISSMNAVFEHRISPTLNFRMAGDYVDRVSDARTMDQFVNRYNIDTHSLTGRQPQRAIGSDTAKSLQADLLASFWTGRTEHKLLLSSDYYYKHSFTNEWRLDAVSVKDPALNDSAAPGGAERAIEDLPGIFTEITPYGVDPAGRAFVHSSDYDEELTTRGIFGSWRMTTFGGRVITLLGGRYEATSYARDNRVLGTDERFSNNGFTPTMGLNVYLTRSLVLFANYSRSYYPVTRSGFDADGDPVEGGLPNEEGAGTDIGLKSRMLDGRFVFTTTYFTIERKNVPYLVDFPAGTSGASTASAYRYMTAGRIDGDGVELDFTVKPSKSLSLFGAYSYNDTTVKDAGYDIDLVGRRWERAPVNRGAGGFRYGPSWLKGLSFGGAVRYEGKSVLANGTAVALGSPPPVNYRAGNDGRREIYNPSYTNLDLSVSYRWRVSRKYRHSVQLNLKNALDGDTFRQSGIPAPERRLILTYRLGL